MLLSRFIIFISLLLLSNSVYSSNATTQINLKRLTVADGLSQGTVHTIYQDNKGFIWLGTDNGINIYDGYTVRELPGLGSEVKNYTAYQIRQGSDGVMWLALSDVGLYSYNVNTGQYQQALVHDPSNPDLPVYYSLENEPGVSEWVITNKTIGIYTRASDEFEQVVNLEKQLTGYDAIYLAEQFGDYLLIATRTGSFAYHIPSKRLEKISFLENHSLKGLDFKIMEANRHYAFKQVDDRLFIGTNDGIFEFNWHEFETAFNTDIDQLVIKQVARRAAIWQLTIDGNYLVFGANDGLYEMDLQTYEVNFLLKYSNSYDHIGHDAVLSFLKDTSGNYWMGSSANGAFGWNPKNRLVRNKTYSATQKALSNNVVMSIKPDFDQPHMLWVGTSNGLNLFNTKTDEIEHFLVDDQSKTTYTQSNILEIKQTEKHLWLFTYKGMVLFDKQQRKIVPLPFSDEVKKWIQQDSIAYYIKNNQLWLSGENGTIRIDISTGELEKLDIVDEKIGLNNTWWIAPTFPNRSNEILFISNDAIWAYHTVEKTLTKLTQFPRQPDSAALFIDHYAIDKNNIIWLAYSGIGLIGLDAKTLEQRYFYHSGNSIIDDNTYGVMADDNGNIWFSSHGGIFRLDADSHHVRHFSISEGFMSDEFNAGAFTKMSDGTMVYGSMLGLSMFNPLTLNQANSEQALNLALSQMSILNRNISVPALAKHLNSIDLNYDDVGIRLDFSTLTYFNSQPVKYGYELSGPVNIVTPASNQNFITFPALESGKHDLTVYAISPYSGKKTAPLHIQLNVSYAPWRSPTAYFMYCLIIVATLLAWMRQRHIRQKELVAAHEEVKFRENRLQLALAGSNSEVWDWLAVENKVYAKRVTDSRQTAGTDAITIVEYLSLIHPEDRELFKSRWQSFISGKAGDELFECTYRLHNSHGQWLWYKDLGKVVEKDKSGLPVRVTGSYTNVTQAKADEERVQQYGDAFRQTKDWVFIIDEGFSKVTANRSLCELFGWQNETFEFDFNLDILGIDKSRIQFYRKLLPSVRETGHWSGEEIVKTPFGDEYHVIMTISASESKSNNACHYIFVMTDISAQKSAENNLRILANYDHLTGLPNRSLLLERIKHGIETANRKKRELALFFIDLDRFKQVNDSLGHDYGDLLLQSVTSRLKKALREDDTIARIGGDEFVVLLEHFSASNDLSRIAQKIINVIDEPIALKNNVVSIGASIGISIYPSDSKNQEELLRNADVAMYHAKQLGRYNFQFFTDEMNEEASQRLAQESALKIAVQNDEFFNLYQPIIDTLTGKSVGAELLMRWESTNGLVMPSVFIPLAEELGLISAMTDLAMNKALVELKKWRSLRKDFYLSINVSAPHFADDDLVRFIADKLKQYKLPASAIKLEVTESAFISEPEKAINTMQALSDLGCELSLDDFGTGYSSLTYLKRLPLNFIKIDRSFVNGIGIEKADEAIIDATLVLARSLHIASIAEGVETKQQMQYLADRDCHFIQGYFYYRPIAADELTLKLQEDKQEIKATC